MRTTEGTPNGGSCRAIFSCSFWPGPHEIREGGLSGLLKAIAWVSLVVGPVLLLLLFLPYHLGWVTWVQRFAVFADIVLLWALWPAVLKGRIPINLIFPIELSKFELRLPLVGGPFALVFSFVMARFPSEDIVGDDRWIPANAVTAWLGATDWTGRRIPTSFHDLLFSGSVDNLTRRRKSLFSNTLVLPGFDLLKAAKIDDEKKLEWAKHTFSLRGRHLEGAVFGGADLRKADLSGAFLREAWFDGAHLQGGSLDGAQLQGAFLQYAQLQGASLDGAQLQGAWLLSAELQGASFTKAELQGA